MEHYDVGGDERLAALVVAVERGDEAVLTRGGVAVAEVWPIAQMDRKPKLPIDLAAIQAFHDKLPAGLKGGSNLVREMRDMDDH